MIDQPSFRNCKCLSYASRIGPLAIDTSARQKTPQVPNGPSLHISPWWDSIYHDCHTINQSRFFESSRQPMQYEATLVQQLPTLASSAVPPLLRNPRSVKVGTAGFHNESPSRSIRSTSSLPNMRLREKPSAIGGLSKPRKQSLCRTRTLHCHHVVCDGPQQTHMSNPTDDHLHRINHLSQVPAWQRTRRPSTSHATP